jgi:outer membrane protein TolC
VELAENLYTNGKATQLEVLDAQLALEVARTNYTSALFEGNVNEITLQKNLGLLDKNR